MSSVLGPENCVSNTCCLDSESENYRAGNLVEQAISSIPTPWGYYFTDEVSGSVLRRDATGQGHHLTSIGGTQPTRVEGWATPWAMELTSAMQLRSEIATMDTLADKWAFHAWLYLGTPAASGTLMEYGVGTKNQIKVRWSWGSPVLGFRMQAGYYPPPLDVVPYEVYLPLNYTAPINKWFFIAASYTGPTKTLTSPQQFGSLILQVNTTRITIPALALDADTPPTHASLNERFYIGPMAGIIGPIGLWTPMNALSAGNIDDLWNDGNGIGLEF